MMRQDLERAGLPYVDEDGLFADFHSNRHTFISNLGKADVSLVMAQKLARHSDPKLTANVYTHLEINDKASAIESLPAPPGASDNASEPNVMQATGTDDIRPHDDACQERLPRACQETRASGHNPAQTPRTVRSTQESGEGVVESPQVLKLAGVGTSRHAPTQAPPAGLEPATLGLEVPCSIQLSYRGLRGLLALSTEPAGGRTTPCSALSRNRGCLAR